MVPITPTTFSPLEISLSSEISSIFTSAIAGIPLYLGAVISFSFIRASSCSNMPNELHFYSRLVVRGECQRVHSQFSRGGGLSPQAGPPLTLLFAPFSPPALDVADAYRSETPFSARCIAARAGPVRVARFSEPGPRKAGPLGQVAGIEESRQAEGNRTAAGVHFRRVHFLARLHRAGKRRRFLHVETRSDRGSRRQIRRCRAGPVFNGRRQCGVRCRCGSSLALRGQFALRLVHRHQLSRNPSLP